MVQSPGDHIEEGSNFGALNQSELAILELLAQGHTAKSMARLTSQSESAVHERLRSARRKTGFASSRELARSLRNQKIWDQKSRDGQTSRPTQRIAEQVRWKRPPLITSTGVLLMGFAVVAAAVLLQVSTQTPNPTSSGQIDDPLVQQAIGPSPVDFRQLHATVRNEKRDEAWAPHTEAALSAAYTGLPAMRRVSQSIRVICGSTLCEVAGWFEGDKASMNPAMFALQGAALRNAAHELGLKDNLVTSFGSSREHPARASFVAYWKRADS